jgi:hypothetical protein
MILQDYIGFWYRSVCTTLYNWHVWLDLEWKVIYVGSAESAQYDQELDNIMVGPVPVGVNKFVFQVHTLSFTSFLDLLVFENKVKWPVIFLHAFVISIIAVQVIVSYFSLQFLTFTSFPRF